MDATEVVDFFGKGMSLLMSIKKYANAIILPLKHYRQSSVVTLDRAVEDYYSGATGIGCLVTIEGLISPYVMSSRPRFDSDTILKMTSTKTSPTWQSSTMKVELGMMTFAGQYPIQTIPPIKIEGKLNYIYFLYPPDLSTFLLERLSGDELKPEIINRTQKPLLVISHENLYSDLNKIVKVTGELTKADADIVDELSNNFTYAQREVLSNSVKPFAEGRTSLCLDLRNNHRFEKYKDQKTIPATIYLESHFENILQIPNYQKFAGTSLPRASYGLHWSSMAADGLFWGLNATDTAVCTSDYESYGFFMDVEINSNDKFAHQLELFHGFVGEFRKTIQNRAREEYRIEIKHKIDFIFDFNRAKFFHPEGVMVSKKVEQILRNNSHLQSEVEWIRGDNRIF